MKGASRPHMDIHRAMQKHFDLTHSSEGLGCVSLKEKDKNQPQEKEGKRIK